MRKRSIVIILMIFAIASIPMWLVLNAPAKGKVKADAVAVLMSSKPSSTTLRNFLRGNSIRFSEHMLKDMPLGDATASQLDLSDLNKVSIVIFRISHVEKRWGGRVDNVIIAAFDKRGKMVESKTSSTETGCLDF